jgi:ureidoacrylate peracid hydrolase
VASFPIAPSETAMLFFDALNIYLHPDSAEARSVVDASGVIPRMVQINSACRQAGIPIFYAQADHRPDGKDFGPQIVDLGYDGKPGEEPRLTAPPQVRSDTVGAEVIPEIAPQPGDYVIKKHRWSAFFQAHLELSLRTSRINTILLAGGSTEVGIASTAYSARDLDLNLIVLRDACSSAKPGVNEFFMDRVFPVFTRVMTVNQAMAGIVASSGL